MKVSEPVPDGLLYFLFFVSGFCGLLYETALVKELTYLFGVSAYAVSAVLASFMMGLAVGSWFFGKRVALRPLALYGRLELAVGAAGIASLFALRGVMKIYPLLGYAWVENSSFASLTLLRFALAIPLVGLPAFFMGGTLPAFAQLMAAGEGAFSSRVVAAYSINTLGGAIAAVLGAYVLIYHWGLEKTIFFSAFLNAGVFLAASILQKYPPKFSPEKSAALPAFNLPASGAYATAFVTGFLSFAYEVVGFHLLGTIIGNTVYAFAIMLFAFLMAILTSGVTACFILKHREAWRWILPGSQILAGLCLLCAVPLWDRIGWIFVWVGEKNPSFWLMETTRFAVSFVLLFGSAFFMTQTFPLLFVFPDRNQVADRTGKLGGANTFGAILGALAGSFFFLPFFGSQMSLEIVALLSLVLGCALCSLLFAWKREMKWGLLLGAICVFTASSSAIRPWNIGSLTSGNYVYFDDSNQRGKVIFSQEDALGGFTTVLQDSLGGRTLMSNGKFQGNNSGEFLAQRNFVKLPALFIEHFSKALVIGLGTGQSLESALEYPFVKVDLAEIAPAIITAARIYFRDVNHDALKDSRVRVHVEDGRNFLLCSRQKYDLITMEISSIWIAGASNLYNREFYELCRAHLEGGGVMQQWIQIHHITLEDIARSLRTLTSVFPDVVFFVSGGQGIAAASMTPLIPHVAAIRGALSASDFYLDEAGVRRFLDDALKTSDPPFISTDDQPILEYSTPYGNSLGEAHFAANLKTLARYSRSR